MIAKEKHNKKTLAFLYNSITEKYKFLEMFSEVSVTGKL